MFITTAVTPLAGTPPWPATGSVRVSPPAQGVLNGPTWVAGRESRMRWVDCALKREPPLSASYHPTTSAMTFAAELLTYSLMAPLVPRATVTRLGSVTPADQLRLEPWAGLVVRSGYAVR